MKKLLSLHNGCKSNQKFGLHFALAATNGSTQACFTQAFRSLKNLVVLPSSGKTTAFIKMLTLILYL